MFRSKWLVLLGVCTFIGLLSFSIGYTEDRLDGEGTPFYYPLIYESTGAYSVFILLPLLLPFMERFPILRTNWYRVIPLHLLASVLFGVTHTLLMTVTRIGIFAILGLGHYKLGDPFFRFIMEYQKQFLIYAAILIGDHFIREYQRNRERDRRTAELELQTEQIRAKLAEAQLHTLKGQIQPHFLFNTLNMISSTMYDDVVKADRLIARLSALLRMSLEHSQQQKIPLKQELDFLNLYLDLMKARFEDKFSFEMTLDPQAECALVPNLILQPLVENAIKHNDSDRIMVSIIARREAGNLVLQIIDNGPGLQQSPYEQGVGLSNTRERLQHLYEGKQGFQFENLEEGGLAVTIQIPYEKEVVSQTV
ncbi:MAG TPA: histidine kinase [Acidobacteriota bacterium]|nr:histidine kinase [Acidobacteriota bacterium]